MFVQMMMYMDIKYSKSPKLGKKEKIHIQNLATQMFSSLGSLWI